MHVPFKICVVICMRLSIHWTWVDNCPREKICSSNNKNKTLLSYPLKKKKKTNRTLSKQQQSHAHMLKPAFPYYSVVVHYIRKQLTNVQISSLECCQRWLSRCMPITVSYPKIYYLVPLCNPEYGHQPINQVAFIIIHRDRSRHSNRKVELLVYFKIRVISFSKLNIKPCYARQSYSRVE